MNKNEDYKDSGSSWIGQIPKHWGIKKLKFLTSPRKELSDTGKEELLSVTEARGIVKRREIRSSDEPLFRADNLVGYRKVHTGDLVSNIMLMWKRGLGVSEFEGIVSPAYSVFKFSDKCDAKYFHYLLRSEEYITEFRKNSTGITMSRLRLYDDSFGAIYSHIPPLKEQKLISRYLDKKTKQIDSLIEKIHNKIELLKEQRTSLINQCVTKGLNPNVDMKDSGFKWIGEIPKHWSISRLKYIGEITLGKMLTPVDKGGMVLLNYLRNMNVQEGYLNLTNLNKMWFLPQEINKLSIRQGDILVSEGGQVGRPCFIEKDIENIGFQNSINRVRTSKVNPKFLYLLILSNFKRGYYDSIVERVSIPHLTKEKLENSLMILPSLEEQKLIAHHLTKKTKQLDAFIEKIQKKIELLKEYRQSLISSVVTGKIRITKDML